LSANTKPINILAIESSCDDTAAAVSQKVHQQYGGVVPELASRAHQQHIVPVVSVALKEAGIELKDLSAVAFTKGPGLIGSLMVGSSFAKSLAYSLGIPLIGIHHMEAHVLAHFIPEPKPEFPFLCLTVSGGHTQIVKMTNYFEFEILGKTIDDAAGEAFDKAAKLLGLPYPGGPLIDSNAKNGKLIFKFPLPQIAGLDFSFSGIKTAILYFLQKELKNNPHFIEENLADLCASVQDVIIKHLIKKIELAAKQTGISQIALAGGVSANSGLRQAIIEKGNEHHWTTFIPPFEYCTDNAAMIGIAAWYKFQQGEFESLDIAPSARLH
jgi:N6-L-threonylcarbamoyladenine synthase